MPPLLLIQSALLMVRLIHLKDSALPLVRIVSGTMPLRAELLLHAAVTIVLRIMILVVVTAVMPMMPPARRSCTFDTFSMLFRERSCLAPGMHGDDSKLCCIAAGYHLLHPAMTCAMFLVVKQLRLLVCLFRSFFAGYA